MATINQYFEFAQLAQASYSSLSPGDSNAAIVNALKDPDQAGFAQKQAETFALGFTVLSQSAPNINGFSATLFQNNATGEKILAIAGTDDLFDGLTDVVSILLLGTTALQLQYQSLKSYYQQLLTEGKLGASETFNVAGHSLGGFLAQSFAVDYAGKVSQTYTYNAPGIGGGVAEVLSAVGVTATNISVANITNIIAEAGPSATAGLGTMLGSVQNVFIEPQTNPLNNHRMGFLTDALAISNLFAKLDPSASLGTISSILTAAANTAANSLEAALAAVGKLYGKNYLTVETTRDVFYTNLYDLQAALASTGTVVSLTNTSRDTMVTEAQRTDATGLAYRYALKALNPFAIVGVNYAPHNQSGELDLYDPATGNGNLTDSYLKDRASFLTWKNQHNARDISGTVFQMPGGLPVPIPGDLLYVDRQMGYQIEVDGLDFGVIPKKFFIFGSDAAETGATALTGGDNTDNLYGGGGDDTLNGGKGDDHLEGQLGNDTLNGEAGRDILIGGADNDTLDGGLGNDRLEGGLGIDTYKYTAGGGFDVIRDIDGQGIVRYNGIDLAGGAQTGLNTYLSADGKYSYLVDGNLATGATLYINSALRIDGFQNGQLGITLGAAIAVAPSSVILGTAGDDSGPLLLNSTAPGQEIRGLAGKDEIYLNHDTTTGLGGTEDDAIAAYGIGHTLRGEDGNDLLQVAYSKTGILTDQNDFVNGVFVGSAEMSDFNAGADRLYGGLGQDRAIAGPGDDLIEGNDGNDYLDGGLGADILLGGEGADVLAGGATQIVQARPDSTWVVNSDSYLGWSGAKSGSNATWLNLYAAAGQIAEDGDDVLDGGGGDDRIEGDAGNDILLGGTGNDVLMGDADSTVLRIALHGNDYLDGGADDDELYGQGGDDELFGGSGQDKLYGDSAGDAGGKDYLDGEEGNDLLVGAGGADELFGGEGDDQLSGDSADTANLGSGDDYLDGEDGIDLLIGGGGADTLFGGIGNDQLHGDGSDVTTNYQGADYLDGEAGNDTLLGYGGNDILIGGTGSDILIGGAGNDTYIFNRGDGVDYVYDDLTPGANTFKFGVGVNPADIKLRQGSLMLDLGNGDQVHITGFDPQNAFNSITISSFEFDDGTVLTSSELLARGFDLEGTADNDVIGGTNTTDRISGFGGDDSLTGNAGNDYLAGGAGNDYLAGGAGDDIYDMAGFGNDVVLDLEGANTLQLVSGTQLDIGLTVVDGTGDLILSFVEGHTITLKNALSSANFTIRFADNTQTTVRDWIAAAILTPLTLTAATETGATILGGAGGDTLTGGAGNDTLYGAGGSDALLGGAGNDVLDGGTGDDTLDGGAGADTYRFARGDGQDRIADSGWDGSLLRVEFGVDILPQDVQFMRQLNGDLTITLGGSTDSLTLATWFTSTDAGPVQFAFGDGSTLDATALVNLPIHGTSGADTMLGSASNETLLGLAGNDDLDGGGGQDQLAGGAGQDVYHLKLGVTQVSITEEAGETSLILLEGARFADLTGVRSGNDLVLGVAGSADAMTLTGYYLQAHDWQVRDGAMVARTVSDVLAENETYRASLNNVDAMKEAFLATWRAQQVGALVSSGHKLASDGRYEYLPGVSFSFDYRTTTAHLPGYSDSSYRSASAYFSGAYTETEFSNASVTSDAAAITKTNRPVFTYLGQIAKDVEVRWGQVRISGSTNSNIVWETNFDSARYAADLAQLYQAFPNGGFSLPTNLYESYVPRTTTTTQQTTGWGTAYGVAVDAPSGAGQAPDGNALAAAALAGSALPTLFTGQVSAYQNRIANEEIYAGNAFNKIDVTYGRGDVVYAGGGGDIIIGDDTFGNGGHLAAPGAGYFSAKDEVQTGAFLYAGDGDDTVSASNGADVLLGGSGDDFLAGGGGSDRYVFLEGETGEDIIFDQGYSEDDDYYGGPLYGFEKWYYQSIGLTEWDWWNRNPATDPPLPDANDFAAWEGFYGNPLLRPDVVELPADVMPGDLSFEWGQYFYKQSYAMLTIKWGVDRALSIVIPRTDGHIGEGVELFKFANGTVLSMADLIALAPPAPTFDSASYQNYHRVDGHAVLVSVTSGAGPLVGNGPYAVLVGGAGADDIYVGPGSNVVLGGAGNDTVHMQADSETLYAHAPDWGQSFIGATRFVGAGRLNLLVPDLSSLTLSRSGNDLAVGGVRLADWFIGGIRPSLAFQLYSESGGMQIDGARYDLTELVQRFEALSGGVVSDGASAAIVDLSPETAVIGGASAWFGEAFVKDAIHRWGIAHADSLLGYLDMPLRPYQFSLGQGAQTISNLTGYDNLLVVDPNILSVDLDTERDGTDLIITHRNGIDSLRMVDWYAGTQSWEAYFAQGEMWNAAYLEALALPNAAPIVAVPLNDQIADEGSAFRYVVPTDAFDDSNVRDTLTYSALQTSGTVLPAWLAFDAATCTFAGTPPDGAAGGYTIRITATDTSGASVFDDFALTVADTLATVQNGTSSANTLNGTAFKDTLNGLGGNDTLYGFAGDDWLDGGSGTDKMIGGAGNDTYIISTSTDAVTENANEGIDSVRSSISYTLSANVEILTLTGAGNVSATGNGLDNLLTGNTASNTLTGNAGNDILQGLSGNDKLNDSAGNNLFAGGAGTDTLTGAAGREIFIGGTGNDTLNTGTGYDVLAFNRGDGVDTVRLSSSQDNTISLGGGIRNTDLAFRKSSNDLILDTGNSESIVFKEWYASTSNKSVLTLQMIEEASIDFAPGGSNSLTDNKVEQFNFAGLVTAFDQARAATPTLTSWALSNALLTFYLGGSDTAAIGGDLAYQYGKTGSLSNIGLTSAQSMLGNAQFGQANQAINQLGLGEGVVRLSA